MWITEERKRERELALNKGVRGREREVGKRLL